MAQKELPITLEEQIDMMKKYVSFRQRIRMRRFYCMQDILGQADMANFCFLMLKMWVINRHRMHCLRCISLMLI